jgi:hypothetical protein
MANAPKPRPHRSRRPRSRRGSRLYEKLGFIVGARNKHPWGTHNRVIQLDGNYIELLTVGEADKVAPHAPHSFSFGAFHRNFLARERGLAMLLLNSPTASKASPASCWWPMRRRGTAIFWRPIPAVMPAIVRAGSASIRPAPPSTSSRRRRFSIVSAWKRRIPGALRLAALRFSGAETAALPAGFWRAAAIRAGALTAPLTRFMVASEKDASLEPKLDSPR